MIFFINIMILFIIFNNYLYEIYSIKAPNELTNWGYPTLVCLVGVFWGKFLFPSRVGGSLRGRTLRLGRWCFLALLARGESQVKSKKG